MIVLTLRQVALHDIQLDTSDRSVFLVVVTSVKTRFRILGKLFDWSEYLSRCGLSIM